MKKVPSPTQVLHSRLDFFFIFLLAAVLPLSAGASLIPTSPDATSGTGLGSVNTVLTVNDATVSDISGCVAWDGATDLVGPAACPAGFAGGDEQAITETRTISELDISSAFNLRLVFNYDEPQSGPEVDDITIEDLELTIYDATDGSICFSSGAFSPQTYQDTFSGIGNSGFVFRLDAGQAAAAQSCFDDLANRIGLAAELAGASQGPETFYLADAVAIAPATTDLSLTKTDSPDPVEVGSTLTYTVEATNAGPNPATGVTVSDTVPASLSGVSATSPDGSCTVDGRVVTCTIGELPAGATATVTITGTPTTTGTITNSAVVVGDQADSDTANNSATEQTDVQQMGGGGGTDVADLSIAKTDSPDPVAVGETLTYTLTVTNGGPDPAPGTTVTDQLPAGVTFVSASASAGSCSTSGATIVCELGTLASGATETVTVTVTPSAPGTVVDTAQVTGDAIDDTPANNMASEETEVVAAPTPGIDLALTKTDSADPVATGATFDYLLEVTNQGDATATGVTLRDDLPAAVTVVSLPPECSAAGGLVTCELGNLAAGAATTVTLTVQAPGTSTVLNNTATVAANETDTDTSDNAASEDTTVGAGAVETVDLSVIKTDSPDPVQVGDQIVYTVTVTNAGPDTATDVRVVDDLSPLVSYVGTSGAGSCSPSGGTVVCDLGALEPGATAEILLTVQADTAGRATDTVTVASGAETDTNPGNNMASEDTRIGSTAPVADLTVTKTAEPDPVGVGQTLTYTVVVSNQGPDTATGVDLTDLLPMEVQYVSASASQGSCAQNAGVVSCALGSLAPGALATVTIRVTPLAPGMLVNTAAVTANESDPDTAENTTTAETTVQEEPVVPIPTASEWGLLLFGLLLAAAGAAAVRGSFAA